MRRGTDRLDGTLVLVACALVSDGGFAELGVGGVTLAFEEFAETVGWLEEVAEVVKLVSQTIEGNALLFDATAEGLTDFSIGCSVPPRASSISRSPVTSPAPRTTSART